MSFAGRVIVITGASEGIGAEIARQLCGAGTNGAAKNGAAVSSHQPKLVLAARRIEPLQAVAGDCMARGAQALAVRCDVSVEADCKALAEAARAKFGRIDILINNAGVSGHALLEDVNDFKWYEDMLRVNLMGSIWSTRYTLEAIKQSKGLIVGVASLAGKVGVPGRTAYSASKFAQAGFFEALRTELIGTGVDVTMIFPGVVLTNIRLNGYGADGKPAGKSGLKEDGAMTVEECARQIIEAVRTRKRELVMTPKARVGLWLKMFAPRLVDRMAMAAVKREG